MMEASTSDYIVLNVGKYGVMPPDGNLSSPTGATMSHGILEKVKSKFSRGSDKNLSSKHSGVESGTGG